MLPGPDARPGYPNASVEIPIRAHLPLSGSMGTDGHRRDRGEIGRHLATIVAGW